LGAIKISRESLIEGTPDFATLHFIFAPGVKSHWKARAVHGYADDVLRHQDNVAQHAEAVRAFIAQADVVVAHNAHFDAGFINREFKLCGLDPIWHGWSCTMMEYRLRGLPGSSSLAAICEGIGISRIGERHGALEDAWLAMQVYLWLHNCPLYPLSFPTHLRAPPQNFREAPTAQPKRKRSSESAIEPVAAANAASDTVSEPALIAPVPKRRGRPRKSAPEN